MPQLVSFEGQLHSFPNDFTSDDIAKALAPPPPAAPQPEAAPSAPWSMYQPNGLGDFLTHLPREAGDIGHVLANPSLLGQVAKGVGGQIADVAGIPGQIIGGQIPTPHINMPSGGSDAGYQQLQDNYIAQAGKLAALAQGGWSPRGAISQGLGSEIGHLGEELAGGGKAPPPGAPGIAASMPPPRGAAMVQAMSPAARGALQEAVERAGVTRENGADVVNALHPESMLGQLNPSMQAETGAVASAPGEAKNIITSAIDARTKATQPRLDQLLTDAFGPKGNLTEQIKQIKTAQSNASGPLWDQFKGAPLPPAPPALIARLNATGAVSYAQKRMGIKGLPAQVDAAPAAAVLPTAGAAPALKAWTPQALQYMKEGIDAQIQKAVTQGAQGGLVRDLTQLKSDLIGWGDQASNGVWKRARDTWASPERVIDAAKLGTKFFDPRTSLYDLQSKMADASGPEVEGFRSGMRDAAAHHLQGSVRGDANLRNVVSSPEAQAKIKWAVGEDRANWFGKRVEQESEFPKSKQAIIGGSPTQPRLEAAKHWTNTSPEWLDKASELAENALEPKHVLATTAATVGGLLGGVPGAVIGGGAGHLAQKGITSLATKRLEAIRNEVAPVLTLKGADRNAALRELLRPQSR